MKLTLRLLTPLLIGGAILPQATASLAHHEVDNCRAYESTFVAVETQNFWVNICGGDFPNTYVGMDKRTGNSIRLPLHDYSPQGYYFEAVNGNYAYLLTKTPRGNFLTVLQDNREILREYTLQDW